MGYLIFSFICFAISCHFDYLLQAYQHGWKTYVDLSHRNPKWGMWDFIPHDLWHIVQFGRNQLLLIGCILAMFSDGLWIFPNWVVLFPVYVAGRGLGFSAFVKFMAKR